MIETVLTASLTVLIGVTVYVLGQIALKFFIEPVHELLKTIGKIGDSLIFYANVYTNKVDPERHKEANTILRQHSALLKSKLHVVKWYSLFSYLGFIPSKKDINEAHSELIFISNLTPRNSTDCITNMNRRKKIEQLLKLSNKDDNNRHKFNIFDFFKVFLQNKNMPKNINRDKILLLIGLILGLSLGVIGNLYAECTWSNVTGDFIENPLIPPFCSFVTIVFYGFALFIFIDIVAFFYSKNKK